MSPLAMITSLVMWMSEKADQPFALSGPGGVSGGAAEGLCVRPSVPVGVSR